VPPGPGIEKRSQKCGHGCVWEKLTVTLNAHWCKKDGEKFFLGETKKERTSGGGREKKKEAVARGKDPESGQKKEVP